MQSSEWIEETILLGPIVCEFPVNLIRPLFSHGALEALFLFGVSKTSQNCCTAPNALTC